MIKLFVIGLTFLFINRSYCQKTNVPILSVKELGRKGTETSFQVLKNSDEYLLKFVNRESDLDSLYVFCKPKQLPVLKAEIEILDTLEVESMSYKGEEVIIIKTGGNILLTYILKIGRRNVKLLDEASL